jgi:hypothetical protein
MREDLRIHSLALNSYRQCSHRPYPRRVGVRSASPSPLGLDYAPTMTKAAAKYSECARVR